MCTLPLKGSPLQTHSGEQDLQAHFGVHSKALLPSEMPIQKRPHLIPVLQLANTLHLQCPATASDNKECSGSAYSRARSGRAREGVKLAESVCTTPPSNKSRSYSLYVSGKEPFPSPPSPSHACLPAYLSIRRRPALLVSQSAKHGH